MRLLERRSLTAATVAKQAFILLVLLAALAQAEPAAKTSSAAAASGTEASSAAAQTTLSDLPNLSTAATVGQSSSTAASSASGTSVFHLSGVPTIQGYGIPTMVIPWTAGAPFMQSTNYPDGFVFIIVGAILGFLGLCVVLWRGAIAWSLHRSVRKAALGTSHYNESLLKLTKQTSAHPPMTAGSNLSLDRLSTMPAGKLTKHGHSNSASAPSNLRSSSLFFSPTAGAGAHVSPTAALLNPGNNRSSTFLPSGYYTAPSAAAPAQGAKTTAVGSGTSPLSSLNPLHPTKKGYKPQPDYTSSPPESPSIAPTYRNSADHLRRGSTDRPRRSRPGGYERVSSYAPSGVGNGLEYLHMPGGAPSGERAPSANLEDLFTHHGNATREY